MLVLARLFIFRNAKKIIPDRVKMKKGHTVLYVYLPLIESFDPVITLPRADVDPIVAFTERFPLILSFRLSLNSVGILGFYFRGLDFYLKRYTLPGLG